MWIDQPLRGDSGDQTPDSAELVMVVTSTPLFDHSSTLEQYKINARR